MSYDVELVDPVSGQTIEFDQPHLIKGGTYAMFGTTEAWLNITYNYGKLYRLPGVFGEQGIYIIEGMSGAESIPVLQKAIAALGDDTDPDYWKATEGNAKKPLYGLLAFAQMRPDGVWEIT